jgi:hypothetical protein
MSAGPLDPAIAAFVIDDLAAATFTPYVGTSVGGVAGAVDFAAVEAHCADLAAHGVRTAFINGTTGDSMCLTQAERRGLHEAWVAAGRKHGVRVLAHVGSSSITEACELAAHAQACGCDAICAMAPSFFKPRDAHALALWLQTIGAAAPKMPLYYCALPAGAPPPRARARESETLKRQRARERRRLTRSLWPPRGARARSASPPRPFPRAQTTSRSSRAWRSTRTRSSSSSRRWACRPSAA